MIVPILTSLAFFAAWTYHRWSIARRAKGHKFPVSPKPSWIPFVGNGLELLNSKKPFASLAMELMEQFPNDDLIMLNSFGNKIILLNTPKVSKDLFELRGNIYSSRAPAPLLRNVICRDSTISFEPHNDTWRRQRKATHLELNINAVKQYSRIQLREAYNLVQGLLTYGSKDFLALAELFANAIAFGSFYDYKITGLHNELAGEFERVNTEKLNLLSPGSSFYDVLPAFIRPHVPLFLMPSLKQAYRTRDESEALNKSMADMVIERLEKGEDTQSFMAGLLAREKEGKALISPFERNSVTGHLVAAAGDTTQSALRLCILAAICFPDAVKRVQAQIDSVVGRERLPHTDDLPHLPLLKAYVLEAMRWRSVTRIGVPHCLDEDDYYEGYFLPKGSTIVQNSWKSEHDESIWGPDTDIVKPERMLNADGSLNDKLPIQSFGAGRRICIGANMASNSLSMAVSCLFWAFDFSKARDSRGNTIEPNISPYAIEDKGTVHPPLPFEFDFKLRNREALKIIEEEVRAVH